MNGRLGTIPTNKHAVEVQLMRKFVDGMRLHSFVHSQDKDVQILLCMMAKSSKRGTLSFIDSAYYSEVVPPAAPVPPADLRQLVCDSIKNVTTIGPSCITSLTAMEHVQLSMIGTAMVQ